MVHNLKVCISHVAAKVFVLLGVCPRLPTVVHRILQTYNVHVYIGSDDCCVCLNTMYVYLEDPEEKKNYCRQPWMNSTS